MPNLKLFHRIMLLFRDYASENLDYARFYANYAFMLKWPKNAKHAHNSAMILIAEEIKA